MLAGAAPRSHPTAVLREVEGRPRPAFSRCAGSRPGPGLHAGPSPEPAPGPTPECHLCRAPARSPGEDGNLARRAAGRRPSLVVRFRRVDPELTVHHDQLAWRGTSPVPGAEAVVLGRAQGDRAEQEDPFSASAMLSRRRSRAAWSRPLGPPEPPEPPETAGSAGPERSRSRARDPVRRADGRASSCSPCGRVRGTPGNRGGARRRSRCSRPSRAPARAPRRRRRSAAATARDLPAA